MKKGIEFADETWNPVWGCNNLCSYCFARPIAKRFAEQTYRKEFDYRIKGTHNVEYRGYRLKENLQNFKPEILGSQIEKKFKTKSTHIFVNSMSDIMYWEPEWMTIVLDRVKRHPNKKFIFFTKDIGVTKSMNYSELFRPHTNVILMYTINTKSDDDLLQHTFNGVKTGICIEPMQEAVYDITLNMFDWVIIGSETGNRKNKIEVQPEWIVPFYDLKLPVFMKESIRAIVPPEKFRQERI